MVLFVLTRPLINVRVSSLVKDYFYTSAALSLSLSNWNEIFETLSRLDANSNDNRSLAASVTTPKDDQLCASLIERSLAASVTSNNPAMEIYNSIFG